MTTVSSESRKKYMREYKKNIMMPTRKYEPKKPSILLPEKIWLVARSSSQIRRLPPHVAKAKDALDKCEKRVRNY